MYNLIVVDDEDIIRNGIVTYIKYSFIDFNVIAVFDDGKKAIKFLKEHDVDIVITDIRMSVVSGIDLAQYIYQTKPHIKVIFLSGYKEFEYAKQAMDFNVKYYLSKPIDLTELDNALNNLNNMIKEENEKRELEEQNSKKYDNLYSLAKADFFANILFGTFTSIVQMEEKALAIGIPKAYMTNKCCVFDARLSDGSTWSYSKEHFHTTMFNLLREVRKVDEYILILKQDYLLTLVAVYSNVSSTREMQQDLQTAFQSLKDTVHSLFNINIDFTIQFIGNDIYSLSEYTELNYRESRNISLLDGKYKELASTIISNKYSDAKEILNRLKQYSDTMDPLGVKNFFSNLFTTVLQNLSDRMNISLDFVDYDNLNHLNDRQKIYDWCDIILQNLFEQINPKSNIEQTTIKKAKEYIQENYMIDITLDDIANYVYLNPTYFSRFFKLHTGVNLTDYLIEVRMNEAIALFKTHKYKVYEISEMCGYKSSKYFAKTFKQYSGYTPTEYSRALLDRSDFNV